jgi:hypothetical protein
VKILSPKSKVCLLRLAHIPEIKMLLSGIS